MTNIHPGWLVAGFIALLILWMSPRGRALLILTLVAFVSVAALKSMTRSETCPGNADCLVDLQPTWAGPCFPSNGGAVLKSDGRYYLTGPGSEAQATCVDWRVWR